MPVNLIQSLGINFDAGPWNWLEVTKLLVQISTPLLIFLIGWRVQHELKRFEHRQWHNQKLIEKRLQVYDNVAPMFNRLLCYYTYVGVWKELSPADIIRLKRDIDQHVHLNAPLFAKEFFSASMAFLDLCFEMYTGTGKDARLRTQCEHHRVAYRGNWENEWEKCFSSAEIPSEDEITEGYQRVIKSLVSEIYETRK